MWYTHKTVYEHEVGLRFHHGRLTGEVGPGRYLLWKGSEIRAFDTRPGRKTIGGQEIMTKDGATLRITLSVMSRIEDARKFYMAQARPEAAGAWSMPSIQAMLSMQGLGAASRVEVQAQILLRDWVAVRTLAQAMEERATLSDAIREPLRAAAKEEGAELLEVEVLDVNISGNIRAAYSDLLRAQLEGEASLQRARNEAATMRNLLNTARLVREHPGLLELRALTSGQKPRVSVVINQAPPAEGTPAEVTEDQT